MLWEGMHTDVEEEDPPSVGRVAWAHDLGGRDSQAVRGDAGARELLHALCDRGERDLLLRR
jgi:hypothetical protein